MTNQHILAGFYIDLLQDVNVLRPLIYLCHDDLGLIPTLILSKPFHKRSRNSIWPKEIDEISDKIQIETRDEGEHFQTWNYLNSFDRGFIVAASESSLDAHRSAHLLFSMSPSHITTITLQHGFECVGFLMNKTHQQSHGSVVSFAADIVCGWFSTHLQRDLLPSQYSKYLHTGPSAWIAKTSRRELCSLHNRLEGANAIGIVCENLHSVRFKGAANVSSFMDQFFKLASFLDEKSQCIALRPHPAGQYSVKNKIDLPKNVILETRPSYKINWSEYSFGISAPSSVLFDLMINQVPAAMWQDQSYTIDISQLPFLPVVSSAEDMNNFACNPYSLGLEHQDQRVHSIYADKELVATRFLSIFRKACRIESSSRDLLALQSAQKNSLESSRTMRLLIMAPDKKLPTLMIALVRPLRSMINIDFHLIDGFDVESGKDRLTQVQEMTMLLVDSYAPDLLILCREYRKDALVLMDYCKSKGVRTLYYIDDLLYEPSLEVLDRKKYDAYRQRTPTIKSLLDGSDAIYCSTKLMAEEAGLLFGHQKTLYGDIVESVDINKLYYSTERRKVIGYTGYGHTQDLALIEDVLIRILSKYQDWTLELIGTMVPSKKLLSLGSQITIIPPERDFDRFLKLLESRRWSIGICPLIDNKFNRLKANIKWIEYSEKNIATVASASPVYSESCSNGCGILCTADKQWEQSLQELMMKPQRIDELVKNAQEKLRSRYTFEHHCNQLMNVFETLLD